MKTMIAIVCGLVLMLFAVTGVWAAAVGNGDVNGDGKVDGRDVREIILGWAGQTSVWDKRDQYQDNKINSLDAAVVAALITPAANPTPIPGMTKGIWISPAEIAVLPIAGQPNCTSGTLCYDAWNHIMAVAQGATCTDTVNLSVYGGKFHARCVYKTALAAARLRTEPGRSAEAARYYDKVAAELRRVMGTEQPAVPNPDGSGGITDGSLAIARNFPQYLVSSDILGMYPNDNPNSFGSVWGKYVRYMAETGFTFRVGDGGHTFAHNHDQANSNGNQMSGGLRMMLDVYLGNKADLDLAFLTFRRYTGDRSVGPNLTFNSGAQTWIHDLAKPVGINPVGAKCHDKNYPADGAMPNDQGRGGGCPADPNTAPGSTGYPWQGLQGAYAQALVLERQGYKDPQGNGPWQVNNQALLRAAQYQWYLQSKFGGKWYTGDIDGPWVKHLIYLKYNFKPIAYKAYGQNENMDLTAWTHPKL